MPIHLREERTVGGEVLVVTVGGQAVGAPVATFQNEFGRSFKAVAGMAFPAEQLGGVAIVAFRKELPATKFRGLLQFL